MMTQAQHVPAAASAESDAAPADEPGEPPLSESPRRPVQLINRSMRAIDEAWLRARLIEAAGQAPRGVSAITLVLIDEDEMRDLHQRQLGDSKVTDVLSFDWSSEGESVEAEVVICVDVAEREAHERGHRIEREILLYALHGLLHCCGWDDGDAESFARMHALEDEVLERIGVGRTFETTAAIGSGGDDE